MQLRELLKNQQILAPLVSAKNMSQQNEWDGFSQLLADKNEKKADKPIGQNSPFENAATRKDDNPKFVKKTLLEKKIIFKLDASVNVGYKPSETKASDASYKTDDKLVDKMHSNSKETNLNKTNDDDASSNVSKLKDALKAKLKKETGLSDDQLNQLLATMDLSTDALKQMLMGSDTFSDWFGQLSETIENLEIDQALDKTLTSDDLTHLETQLKNLVATLNQLESDVPKTIVDDDSEFSNKAISFETRVTQALSKIISDLNVAKSESDDASIRPEDVRHAIMQAIAPVASTLISHDNAKAEETGPAITATLPNVLSASNSQSNASDSTMKGDESANPNTSQQVSSSSVQTQNQTFQPLTSQPTESVKQDVIQTEADVKTNEGISMHQLAMKQGNSIITATVQQTPQLKQEIFTQIMDAIKGQIKLSDHGTSLLVKLQPEQLGNVELKLNIHKGIVLAEIKVENEIVKAAIESNLDNLKQSLSNKGYSVDQINVNVDSGKKDRQETFEFDQQERRNRQNQKNDVTGNLEPIEGSTKYIVDEYEGSTINYYG